MTNLWNGEEENIKFNSLYICKYKYASEPSSEQNIIGKWETKPSTSMFKLPILQ